MHSTQVLCTHIHNREKTLKYVLRKALVWPYFSRAYLLEWKKKGKAAWPHLYTKTQGKS